MGNNKVYHIAILLFLFLISAACAGKSPEQLLENKAEYLKLCDLGDFLNKQSETARLDIDNDTLFFEGWGSAEHRDDLVWRWSNGKESTVRFYAADIGDRIVKMHVWPFNPAGEPYAEGEVYVNGELLTSAVFSGTGYYDYVITIPARYLHIGSNLITFKWKYERSPKDFNLNKDSRTLSIAVSSMEVLRTGGNPDTKKGEFKMTNAGDRPALLVPRNGIVEVSVDLPDDPVLAFGLLRGPCKSGGVKVNVCITNDTGEAITGEYTLTGEDTSSDTIYAIDLGKFSNESARIVFSNAPMTDDDSCSVQLVNPAIYSSADTPFSTGLNEKEFSGKPDTPVGEIITVKKPHVFIYLIDTLRADHLHCYGYDRETSPNIDALSEDGVVFENCFGAASWTRPTVASILTGIYPHKHLAQDRQDKLSKKATMLSEILKKAGYTTIYITANGNTSGQFGFNQGNDFYLAVNRHTSDEISNILISHFDENPEIFKKPVFAYIHTIDPHVPYRPEKRFMKFCAEDSTRNELGISENIKKRRSEGRLLPDDVEYMKCLYDGEILQNDAAFGKFIDYLKKAGVYDDSLIIVVADHGEQFMEHGGVLHGGSIYNEEIHVPLIVKLPGSVDAGTRIADYVTQVDIVPTVMEFAGMEIPDYLDGISLVNILRGIRVDRSLLVKDLLDGTHNYIGIIDVMDKDKVIVQYPYDNCRTVVRYEKYDLSKDFCEGNNLVEDPDNPEINVNNLRINYFIKHENPSFLLKEKTDMEKLNKETIDNLKDLGYM
jgi:choline-sulfatase